MIRALDYLKQPGAKPGFLPFFNLFYETWDLLKAKKLPEAEAKLKIMDKMNGDENAPPLPGGFSGLSEGRSQEDASAAWKRSRRTWARNWARTPSFTWPIAC